MRSWFKGLAFILLLVPAGSGCGKDEKSSADKAAEAQRAIQQGGEKERKMVEGMQKGMESLEKSIQEQKEKTKK